MQLQIFENSEFAKIRTIMDENNEVWFVGKDIAENLGYANTRDSLIRHVEDEDKKDGVVIHDAIGRKQTPTLINESGLYSLILSSKLPQAKKFKRWITSEVLPSIRQEGIYMTKQKANEIFSNPDTIIDIANRWKKAEAKLAIAETTIEENKPKVLFADTVSASNKSCLIGELAKLISQEAIRRGETDKKIGQNRMFNWLRSKGYLCKSGERKNQPTQKYIEQGLFELKVSSYMDSNGVCKTSTTPKVTGKGQIYFVDKFLG